MTTATEVPPPPLLIGRGCTVLVPLDGSEEAVHAWHVARVFAELHEVDLRALYLGTAPIDARRWPAMLGLSDRDLRGAIIEAAVGPSSASVVRSAQERACGLVVASAHFDPSPRSGRLGPFVHRLLRSCASHVVIVPEGFDATSYGLRKVLLPQDGTPSMALAIAPALHLANRAQATLYVLHVADIAAPRAHEPGSYHVPRYVDQAQHEWPAWSQEFMSRIERLGHAPSGMKSLLRLAHGEPGDAILSFADEHEMDLIVLAWHGRLEPNRAMTLRAVVSRSSCPVLVLRGG